MRISRRTLGVAYAVTGVIALVGTWGNVLAVIGERGFVRGSLQLWQDTLLNPASRFITVDLLFLGLAVIVLMVLESRRLGIGGVWLYVGFGLLVAISLALPMFLIHREAALAGRCPGTPAGYLHGGDMAGLGLLAMLACGYAVVSLLN